MSKFIEITTATGNRIINIDHIVSVYRNLIGITIIETKPFNIEVKETYEQVKDLI